MIRIAFLLGGLALFLYLTFQLGPGQIVSMLLRIGWSFLLVALIYSCYQLARAAALSRCLLRRDGASYRDMLWIRLSGEAVQFLTFTGPFLAEPAKAWLLKKRGLTIGEAFAATITEYLVYTFTSAAISIVGLTYLVSQFEVGRALSLTGLSIVSVMAVFLVVSAIAIVFRIYLIGTIIQGIARLPLVRDRLRPDLEAIHRMEDLLLEVLRERPLRLLSIIAIELVAQILLIFEVYWILRTLALSFPIAYPFLIEAAIKFASLAFFFIPTQLGATEGTYAVVFQTLRLVGAAGFTLAFVRRLRSLLVAGVGLVALSLLSGREAPRRDAGNRS